MIRRVDLVADAPRNGSFPTICIDGRGASGKTTLAQILKARLAGWDVIHGDDYFEPHDDPITWGDFNEARFDADVLAPIRAGERDFTLRPFDFPKGQLGSERALSIDRGLIVERWFALALDAPWDVTVWVETPAEVCLQRGLERDGAVELGGRARLAWETVWQPREARYIRETRPLENASLVVDGTAPFDHALEELVKDKSSVSFDRN